MKINFFINFDGMGVQSYCSLSKLQILLSRTDKNISTSCEAACGVRVVNLSRLIDSKVVHA